MLGSEITVRFERRPLKTADVLALCAATNTSEDGVVMAFRETMAQMWTVQRIEDIHEVRLLSFTAKMEATMTREQGPLPPGTPRLTTDCWLAIARIMHTYFPVDDAVVAVQTARLRGDPWGAQGL